jgi:glutamate 5-kinase
LFDPETGEIILQAADTASVMHHARLDKGKFSMGGMSSKLSAIQHALDAGIECCIANGRHPQRLGDIINGKGICTRFDPRAGQ